MATEISKKWHQKPGGVVLLLIFFFPVGLYLMWKNKVWSKTTRWVISAIFVVGLAMNDNDSSTFSDSVNSIDETEKCIVGFDWVYPSYDNPTAAWKFSADGTFSFSTTMFGGSGQSGNWNVTSPGKVNVSYTSSTRGQLPDDKTLTMSSC